jgi:hypothetical protein
MIRSIFQFHQAQSLCKWVIKEVEGHENWKVLLCNNFLQGAQLRKKGWKHLNLPSLLFTPTKFQIIHVTFLAKNIWKS